jgi:hypothetical protein
VKVDGQIISVRAKLPDQLQVGSQPSGGRSARGENDFVEMRVAKDHRRGFFFNEVRKVGVGEAASERPDGGRREDDVADQAKADQQDLHAVI